MVNEVNKTLGHLYKRDNILPGKSLNITYKSFIRPCQDYVVIIYDLRIILCFIKITSHSKQCCVSKYKCNKRNVLRKVLSSVGFWMSSTKKSLKLRGTSRQKLYQILVFEFHWKRSCYRKICFLFKVIYSQ